MKINPCLLLLLIFSLLVSSCKNHINENHPKKVVRFLDAPKKSDTVLIVTMNFNEQYLLPIIGAKVTSFYHLPVKFKESYLPQFAYYAPRNRFRADSLISYLKRLNKGKYRFAVGLTSKDISCTNENIPDWGVFGLGSLDASGCISSTFRLKKGVSTQKLTERLEKVVLHEIGHNYGLPHCTTPFPCFMKAADGKISEVDSEPLDICKICRGKIKLN